MDALFDKLQISPPYSLLENLQHRVDAPLELKLHLIIHCTVALVAWTVVSWMGKTLSYSSN